MAKFNEASYEKFPDKFLEEFYGIKLRWYQRIIVRLFCKRDNPVPDVIKYVVKIKTQPLDLVFPIVNGDN